MASHFQLEFGFKGTTLHALNGQGALYVDQKREVYNSLGCNRGLKFVLNPKSLDAMRQAFQEGYPQGRTKPKRTDVSRKRTRRSSVL